MDKSADADLNITLSSVGSFFTSTPRNQGNRRRLFAIPAVPAQKRTKGPVIGTCSECGKEYRSKKYFENHIQSHKLKSAAVKYPNKDKLLREKAPIVREVLLKMKGTAAIGQIGKGCSSLVQEMFESVVADNTKYCDFLDSVYIAFVDVLQHKQFCLPSVLYISIQKVVEDSLTNTVLRNNLFSNLKSPYPILEWDIFNTFLVEFIFTLGDKLMHYIATCVTVESRQGPLRVTISEEERQLIHYVSGAIIRAFLRKCHRFKNNYFWNRLHNAVMKCILEGDIVVSAADSDKYWTEFLNRGALLFVGKAYMEFMVSVVELLYSTERPDGSLLHDEVQEKLLHSNACVLWDQMIGNSLTEDESISFMRGVVRSFTSSYGRGISKKHLNKAMKRPKVSMSLRKRLGASSDG